MKDFNPSFFNRKKILIAGATGLVGSHALIAFKNIPGSRIRAVYHQRRPHIFSDNIHYKKADLGNPRTCAELVKGMDYVLMFAAKVGRHHKEVSYHIPNLTLNLQMLEAAYHAGVKKILWLSSATAYPPLERSLKEEDMFKADPNETYFAAGWITRYIETLYKMYAAKMEPAMTSIILRPTAIYGEYDDFDLERCHVLPALVRKAVERRRPIQLEGRGDVRRDFIYAGDVVDASLRALERIDGFEQLNLGYGRSYTVKELLNKILKIDGYEDAKVIYGKSGRGASTSIKVDCKKAARLLGFKARTSLDEGLAKTIEWFRKTAGLS